MGSDRRRALYLDALLRVQAECRRRDLPWIEAMTAMMLRWLEEHKSQKIR